VEQFELKKKPLVDQMNELIQKFTSKQATLDQLEPVLVDLGETLNDTLYDLWKKLMSIEMQLYEQCEVSLILNVCKYSKVNTYIHTTHALSPKG
jgi:hypothetical protein